MLAGEIMAKDIWFVYLLEFKDGSFYTGVTNDVDNRMKVHASGEGSRYVRKKGFEKLLFAKPCGSKSDACKCEYQIKQLSHNEKLDYFYSSEDSRKF